MRDSINKIASLAGTNVEAFLSTELNDLSWDSFLRTSPLGQFQQSSMWARVKALEGWSCIRVVMKNENDIVGGFQLLWKKVGPFAIGYISKGPVLKSGNTEMVEFSIELIRSVAQKFHISAIIVHVPDRCSYGHIFLHSPLFLPNVFHKVIEHTLIVDVGKDLKALEHDVAVRTRRKIRKAMRAGIKIREGNADDVNTFFKLMLTSCQRQGEKRPNPPTAESMFHVWELFHAKGCIRMTLAEYSGKPISGLLCIAFGETLSLWKKGWNTEYGNLYPNELLHWEALDWAWHHSYRYCDFGSLRSDIAASIAEQNEFTEDQKRSRDIFNLRFGGQPLALPKATLYFVNPITRLGYRIALGLAKSRLNRNRYFMVENNQSQVDSIGHSLKNV